MMWFFAILTVLALGGIGLVAAGWGSPLVRVYDDRPDVTLPEDRPLTGDDLRRVRFGLVLRGYRMSEVDVLLTRLAGQLEASEEGARRADGEQHGDQSTD